MTCMEIVEATEVELQKGRKRKVDPVMALLYGDIKRRRRESKAAKGKGKGRRKGRGKGGKRRKPGAGVGDASDFPEDNSGGGWP